MVKNKKNAQQEMVGFVLIVAIVLIALMVFLVISIRNKTEFKQSDDVVNFVNVLMMHTTECAIVYEPDYDNVKDLIKSCYNNQKCKNLNKMACDYLNESLSQIMGKVMETDASVSAYELDIAYENNDERNYVIPQILKGNCSGSVYGGQQLISVESGKITVLVKFCYN